MLINITNTILIVYYINLLSLGLLLFSPLGRTAIVSKLLAEQDFYNSDLIQLSFPKAQQQQK